MKTLCKKLQKASILVVILLIGVPVTGQDKGNDYKDLEEMQEKTEDLYSRIYKVIEKYPEFTYKYVYEDGEVEEVIITGIEDKMEAKRVEVWLYDYKKNKEMMKNIPTRTGIYYSVDKEAEPAIGYREMYEKIQNNLKYPEGAQDAGVEGTVFVKMVIDSEGEIAYITAAEDIESPYTNWVEDMKEEAKKAVKETSGNWEPAEVNGRDVASLAVVPVSFDFRKNPSLPALIR